MFVIDCETGGLDPALDALVSVAAIHAESGAEFSMLIRPHVGLALNDEALEVNGLSRAHLEQEGTDEKDAMGAFAMWLHVFGHQEWMGCNPQFDRAFIDAAFARHEIGKRLGHRPIVLQAVAWLADSLGLIELPHGSDGLPKRSLDAILGALGLSRGSDWHGAMEDCQLTLAAYKIIKSRFSARIQVSVQ